MNIEKYLSYFINASEKAAISCFPFIGLGDKIASDRAATNSMRNFLNSCEISAIIKVGEGEMDNAPMLFNGEKIGNLKESFFIDIGVDPLEGTNLCANGKNGSITSICYANSGSIINLPDIYMDKMIVKNGHGHVVSFEKTFEQNLIDLSVSCGKKLNELKIIMLERYRHNEMIKIARSMGAKVFLISDGDICASIEVYLGIYDMYCGIGGAPEGVLSAACAKSFNGGNFLGKLIFDKNNKEAQMQKHKINKIEYNQDELINGDCFFIASAITNNNFMNGIKKSNFLGFYEVETIVFSSKTKSFRIIKSFIDTSEFKDML